MQDERVEMENESGRERIGNMKRNSVVATAMPAQLEPVALLLEAV